GAVLWGWRRSRDRRCYRGWSSGVCSSDLFCGSVTHTFARGLLFFRLTNNGEAGPICSSSKPNFNGISGKLAFRRRAKVLSAERRSEERRVGKEGRARKSTEQQRTQIWRPH